MVVQQNHTYSKWDIHAVWFNDDGEEHRENYYCEYYCKNVHLKK